MDPNADMQIQRFSIDNIRTVAWTFFSYIWFWGHCCTLSYFCAHIIFILIIFSTFWITFSLDSFVLICLKNSCWINLSDFSAMYEGILFPGKDRWNESNLFDVGRLFIDPILCVCLITKLTSVSLLSFGRGSETLVTEIDCQEGVGEGCRWWGWW